MLEVTGHPMDSGILSRFLDDIRDYVIDQFDVGHEPHGHSSATRSSWFRTIGGPERSSTKSLRTDLTSWGAPSSLARRQDPERHDQRTRRSRVR